MDDVKTDKSNRLVSFPNDVIEALRIHRVKQNKKKLAAGECYTDKGFVFATELGNWYDPRNLTRKFHSLIKEAGIKHTNFHLLRHTYATRLLEKGIHPKVVSELLGHSSFQITLDTYSHVLEDIKSAAVESLNGSLRAQVDLRKNTK